MHEADTSVDCFGEQKMTWIAPKHSPGPWEACHDGECRCGFIRNHKQQIAVVTSGEWGDPDGEGGIVVYGDTPEDEAAGNRKIIQAAEAMAEALAFIMNRCTLYGPADRAREKVSAVLRKAGYREEL